MSVPSHSALAKAVPSAPNMSTDSMTDPVATVMHAFNRDEIGIVQAASKILSALAKADLSYQMRVNPRQVGFDPVNRDALGCTVQEVHLLADDIAFVGFSWSECSHALCVEIEPGDQSVHKFNAMLCNGVDLAPVPENSLKFASLSCGHTNFGLRAIAAGVPSSTPWLSENGRMSLDKLRKRDQEYADAVDHGLHWTVLKAVVRSKYPDILPLLQAAKNVGGHVALHSMAAEAQKLGHDANWVAIKRAVLRSRPPFADSVDEMVAFLATRSGGADGKHLQSFLAFHRAFVNPSVRGSVPAAWYSALAAFPVQYVAMAILQAAYSCPLEHVKNGMCCFISSGDVYGLSRNKPKEVNEAEKALSQARIVSIAAGLQEPLHTDNRVLTVFVKFDIAIARFLLNKQGSSKDNFDSVGAIGHVLATSLKDLKPELDFTKLEELFPATAKPNLPKPGVEATSGGGIALYTTDMAGNTVSALAQIRKHGVDIGSCVATAESADLFRVASIGSAQEIVLEPWKAATKDQDHETSEVRMSVGAFLAEWSLRDPKAVLEAHPAWPACQTFKVDSAHVRFGLGHVFSTMATLSKVADQYFKIEPLIDVF
jgi:hypothetical protein